MLVDAECNVLLLFISAGNRIVLNDSRNDGSNVGSEALLHDSRNGATNVGSEALLNDSRTDTSNVGREDNHFFSSTRKIAEV